MDVSSEMVFHLLPLFLANVLGVRTAFIGLIEGIAEATASLLKMVSGWLSDRLRQRKWLAVIGYGLCVGTHLPKCNPVFGWFEPWLILHFSFCNSFCTVFVIY